MADKDKDQLLGAFADIADLLEDKNETVAMLEIRMFIMYYLKGLPGSKEIKVKICNAKSSEEMFKILDEYEKGIQ